MQANLAHQLQKGLDCPHFSITVVFTTTYIDNITRATARQCKDCHEILDKAGS
jgi:hypothetical protein